MRLYLRSMTHKVNSKIIMATDFPLCRFLLNLNCPFKITSYVDTNMLKNNISNLHIFTHMLHLFVKICLNTHPMVHTGPLSPVYEKSTR